MPKTAAAEPASPSTLPRSLVAALPSAADLASKLASLDNVIVKINKELEKARGDGAIALARSFVVLHRLITRCEETLKPLKETFEQYKTLHCPQIFEQEGVTSVPLAEGFRIGVSVTLRASIKPEQKDYAYQWLRENKLGDLITSTVNASTLSGAARSMEDDQNIELPTEYFNVAKVPTTSVTKTK